MGLLACGKDHFAAAREAAQWVQEAVPSLPDAIRRSRLFFRSSVHALAETSPCPGPSRGLTQLIAQELFVHVQGVYNQLSYGVLLVIVVLVVPGGLASLRLRSRRTGRQAS